MIWELRLTKPNTGEVALSGVDLIALALRFLRDRVVDWPVRATMTSERSQQNRTYESEHGQYHEHVELHGKVHRRCSILVDVSEV